MGFFSAWTKDLRGKGLSLDFSQESPDASDSGKFSLLGLPARIVIPRDGYRVNISKTWWSGGWERPQMHSSEFHWYAFPVRARDGTMASYYVCDYIQMRDWVREFKGPLGDLHRHHHDWRCALTRNKRGEWVFCWGDEHPDSLGPSRRILLNNVERVLEAGPRSPPPPSMLPVPREVRQAQDDEELQRQYVARRARRGQRRFRKNMLDLYGGKCAISGEAPEEVLEAAHILLHARSGINHTSNGILLRADLHILFDEGLIRIHPLEKTVWVHPKLRDGLYGAYHGVPLRPRTDARHPAERFLEARWAETMPH